MMKKFYISIFCFFPCIAACAQNISIQDTFYQDNISYKQFLDLGKANCMDILIVNNKMYMKPKNNRNNLFAGHFNTISALQSMLPYFYRASDIKKALTDYQTQNIGKVIKKFREREEYFNINRSPLLICGRLFAESADTKKLYRDFIYSPKNLIPYPDKDFVETYRTYFNKEGRIYD